MIKNFLFLFLLSSINIFGQSRDVEKLFEPTETDSLYILAIDNYTKRLDTLHVDIDLEGIVPKVLYLEDQVYLSRIPEKINNYRIIRLTLDNRKHYFRKNNNKLSLVSVSPLTIDGGLFSITLIPYAARLRSKRKLFLEYSYWNTTYFKFVENKLIFDRFESGGI